MSYDAQEMQSQPCVQLFEQLRDSEMQQAQEVGRHLQEVIQKGKM